MKNTKAKANKKTAKRASKPKKAVKSEKSAPKNADSVLEALNKNPTEENWKEGVKLLKSSKAKYYRIFYEKGLKDMDNLRNAYAIIYDGSYKRLFRIPIIEMKKGSVEGATRYLVGLKINNRK